MYYSLKCRPAVSMEAVSMEAVSMEVVSMEVVSMEVHTDLSCSTCFEAVPYFSMFPFSTLEISNFTRILKMRKASNESLLPAFSSHVWSVLHIIFSSRLLLGFLLMPEAKELTGRGIPK